LLTHEKLDHVSLFYHLPENACLSQRPDVIFGLEGLSYQCRPDVINADFSIAKASAPYTGKTAKRFHEEPGRMFSRGQQNCVDVFGILPRFLKICWEYEVDL